MALLEEEVIKGFDYLEYNSQFLYKFLNIFQKN